MYPRADVCVLESGGCPWEVRPGRWRFTFANLAAARLAQMSPDELVGQDARRFPPPARLQEVMAALQRAMRERVSVELDAADPSREHSYGGTANPLRDGGLAVHVRDVMERARNGHGTTTALR